MVKSMIIILGLALSLGSVNPIGWPDQAIGSTTFTRVSVQAVDPANHSVTFRTLQGQVWTLTAASPD